MTSQRIFNINFNITKIAKNISCFVLVALLQWSTKTKQVLSKYLHKACMFHFFAPPCNSSWCCCAYSARLGSSSEPDCVNEEDLYYAKVVQRHFGPATMPLMLNWTAPGISNFTSSLSVTSHTAYTFTFYTPLTPAPSQKVIYTMYFQPPSAVVVPGTIQATNAPTYIRNGSIELRQTVFVRK